MDKLLEPFFLNTLIAHVLENYAARFPFDDIVHVSQFITLVVYLQVILWRTLEDSNL